ncbi:DUF5007 domain-containing protein [Parapedobacter tibetensis]|uniref:DUF5007 domain-containing protein n=1 Tax=Parapedobacter tibetensis TaxID=2972951 RepID=UPI00214D3BCB|nr:DUF5007 domain-containing protein [Parapedobacter tibetensis]
MRRYNITRSINTPRGAMHHIALIGALLCAICLGGCEKALDLPEEKEFISENINYGSKLLEPIIGRTNLMGQFNSDNSSLPLTFEIVNARYGDGRPVTDLFEVRPTYVWIDAYDGEEASLEEIEAKRRLEDRPLFEVRESGQFILWASTTNELIGPRPTDSSNLVQDIRHFDLKVSNSGGEVYLADFQLVPWRERPYFPYNDINPYTGEPAPDPIDPRNPNKQDYIRPRLSGVVGANSNNFLVSNNERKDVVVYIRPFEGGNGHNLRFKFMANDSTFINPDEFNETNWNELVHGFNTEKTEEYVQYDVAYPIPLVNIQTPYTNGGSASVNIEYSRRGFGGGLIYASFGLDFNIYRPGDWEIVFHFKNELPKFEDE